MNERERFRRLFDGEQVDRPPLLEEGVRGEVIESWHKQGLPLGRDHLEVFGLTPHENVGPDLMCQPRYFGRIMDLSVRDYGRAFNVSSRRFPKDWSETVRRLENRDHIVCIWASRGFFPALGVRDWPTLEQALFGVIEKPRKIRKRMEMYGHFCARMLDMTLGEVDPEFIFLSEPISNNKGPLISPSMFEEFMIPVYERIVAVAREHGCERVLVSTYGNTARLFPAMIKAGVTMLWISEAAEVAELDYGNLRRQYGPQLGLIGGIPLSILRSESAEIIKDRLEETMIPLLRSGRYIPLASGRVRKEVPWTAYKYYREAMSQIMLVSQSATIHGL
jgi:hypothetical protein